MIEYKFPENTETTSFVCPICKHKMLSSEDAPNSIRGGGFTVWCGQAPEICPAQDVSGHGKSPKDAFEIVKEKFIARKDR